MRSMTTSAPAQHPASDHGLPPAAWLVALASVPLLGPARLRALLALGDPRSVLERLAAGAPDVLAALAAASGRAEPTSLLRRCTRAAADVDVAAVWDAHVAAGVAVLDPARPPWPPSLDGDPDPPAVLFARGDPAALDGPTVAIVGTRRCTRYGWDIAHRLGTDLAGAGVVVISGLAVGIDAAAHRGAVDAGGAPPVGVVATGLDVTYPRRNARLWDEVAATGLLVGEAPLGTRPDRWRFPARNRIIAALADVVVIVESATRGGALHTVDEAIVRDRPVLAVPGPVTSAASAGTNRLLADVAAPACDADDVLLALGLSSCGRRSSGGGAGDGRPPPGLGAQILDALGWTPGTLDAVVAASGVELGTAAAALAELETAGWVVSDGGWYSRVHR